jgi:hypothetical protein
MLKKIRNIIQLLLINKHYLRAIKYKHSNKSLFGAYFKSFLYKDLREPKEFIYKKIKLKQITRSKYTSNAGVNPHSDMYAEDDKYYKWEALKNSIQKYGNLKPIVLYETSIINEYVIVNGHHRYKVLIELYSEDYEITVKVIKKTERIVRFVNKLVRNISIEPSKNTPLN